MKKYEEIINKYTEITADGYGISVFEPLSDLEKEEKYRQAREDLKQFEPAFAKCLEWLENNSKFDRKVSSYGLKHQVERYFRNKGESVYVPNGVFILAALASGYTIHRQVPDGPNVMFL